MIDFSTDVRNEFYRENFFSVDMVYLGLPDNTGAVTNTSPLRLCTGGIDHTWAGYTYTAQGDFIGFDTVSSDFDVKVGKFNIYLSGLTSGMVDRFLNQDFEGKQVQIAKAFLNYDTLQIIDRPYVVFDGTIYNVSINESAVTCQITVQCATIWADFNRTSGRKTNNESNWLYQGNRLDHTFDKTSTVGTVSFNWGKN